MKKLIILCFIFFLIKYVNAQWEPLDPDTSGFFEDVFFVDSNHGYIVGIEGIILKTTDGGDNWTLLNLGFEITRISSIHFTSIDTGYLAGYLNNDFSLKGYFCKTTDGGRNWIQLVETSNTSSFHSIYFTDDYTGYVVGFNNGSNIIMKTTDGGLNWLSQDLGNTYPYEVFFPTKDTGYILGSQSTYRYLLKTNDGGTNWTSHNFGNNFELNAVYFTDVKTGYIAGHDQTDDGIILNTVNGGEDWAFQTFNTTDCLNSVFFTDLNTGYIVGPGGLILKTTEAGETWFEQYSGTTSPLYSIYLPTTDTGYIAGDGIILKTTNGGGDPVGINDKQQSLKLNIYPNPAHHTITISSKNGTFIEEITIFNQTGQKVYHGIPEYNTLDISKLQPGMYVVEVATKDGIGREKLLVK